MYKERVIRNVGGCEWIDSDGVRCEKKHTAKGLCELHWRRHKNGQDMDAPKRHARCPVGTVRTNTDGYQQIKTDDLQWKSMHIWVKEQGIKRSLRPSEEVHHKNGQRDDNRLENLELWNGSHPSGQRVEDKLQWCNEFALQYGYYMVALPDECQPILIPVPPLLPVSRVNEDLPLATDQGAAQLLTEMLMINKEREWLADYLPAIMTFNVTAREAG